MPSFQLLGSLELRDQDGQSVRSVLAQPKRIGILAYLALTGGFSQRETLLPIFWPEQDAEHARAALRQAIHQLRRSLGAEVLVGRGDNEIGIAEGALSSDVAAFSEFIRRGEWEAALAHYGGDLLPGFSLDGLPEFEQWLEGTRVALRREAARAAGECASEAERHGDLPEAVRWSRRQLELSPADETALRRLVERLRDAGDRAGALEAYEEFRLELEQCYELEPAAETRRLIAELHACDPTGEAAAAGMETDRRAGSDPGRAPATAPAPVLSGARSAVPARAVHGRPRRAHWVALASIALVAALGLVRLPFLSGTPPESETISIAVLPIEDISADSSAGYIAHGMTEELISALGGIPGTSVTSSTTGHTYEGSGLGIREIGRRLGVDHVLEGSVQRDGDRLRVSIRLIGIPDGRQRWSESYDRRVSDVLAIRDDIGARVVEALQSHLAFPEPESHDAVAYDDYLKARFLMKGRSIDAQTRPRIEQAIRLLHRATEREPGFARAHAELADAYLALADFSDPGDALSRAKAAAERALELDGGLAEVYLALGNIRLAHDWDWEGAERDYRRALELDRELPEAYYAYARFLRVARRFDEAYQQTRRGLALEQRAPHDPLTFAIRESERLATAHLFAREYPEAIAHAKRALELEPHALSPRISLALASQMIGDHATAIETLEMTREDFGDRSPVLWRLGDAYAQVGRREEAREILRLLLDRQAAGEYIPGYQVGLVQLGLGEVDEAIRSFESAIDSRPGWWVMNFNGSPRYDAIRDDPRFRRLLRKIDAPE